ncbi:MAG: D-alanine--D-alanine ligase [Nitrospirae bacterium]|nr:MAG: D-alanine--D-alanine ligase [Nitrospirota bacterium]
MTRSKFRARASLRVGVLMGGRSAERAISLRTGQAVGKALDRLGYRVIPIDVDSELPWHLRTKKVQVAFLALHGGDGEDGSVQGLLEILGIPYTGSGVRASAIAMDKVATKALLRSYGIPVPSGTVVHRDRDGEAWPSGMAFPVVVKPASQGSTIGVSVVRNQAQWKRALRHAYRYGATVIAETYIPGREITLSVLDGHALPAVEVVAPQGFYDYAAKYQRAETRYHCPAPLSAPQAARLSALAERVYSVIECAGAARVDVRLSRSGRPFVLEVNTIPGMTERSLLPMAAAQAGLEYDQLVERMLRSAIDAHLSTGADGRVHV